MSLALSRRKAPELEKALDLVEEAERDVSSAPPVEQALEAAHDRFGNAVVLDALSGGEAGGLGALLAEELALAASGQAPGPLLGAAPSNQVMLDRIGASRSPPPALRSLDQSAGEPLPEAVRLRMEATLGHDFRGVRIHRDGGAAEDARAIGARAFTVGRDIYFGPEGFRPDTSAGLHLLAHELTHVVQHDEGRLPTPTGEGLEVSQPSDPSEREAETVAAEAVSALAGADLSGGASFDDTFNTSHVPEHSETVSRLAPDAPASGSGTEGGDPDFDVDAALAEGLSPMGSPPAALPSEPVSASPPPPDGGDAAASALSPPTAPTASLGRTEIGASPPVSLGGTSQEAPTAALPTSGGGGGTGYSGPVPEVGAAYAAFQTVVQGVRARIGAEVQGQAQAIRQAAQAARAAVEAARLNMAGDVQSAFADVRSRIEARAASSVETLARTLETRRQALREANEAERDRVLETSRSHQEAVRQLIEELAQGAIDHGNAQSEALTTQANAQAQACLTAGAAVAAQYAGHDREHDISVTVTRMAQESAGKILAEIGSNASQLAVDGQSLADKLRQDGQAYLDNLRKIDEGVPELFAQALREGEQTLQQSHDETVRKVEEARDAALGQVDAAEGSVSEQLDTLVSAQLTAIDTQAETAVQGLLDAGQRATEALDAEVTRIDTWLAGTHPSQWPGVVAELERLSGDMQARGDAAVVQLQSIGVAGVDAFTTAGEATSADIGTVAGALQPQLDRIVDGLDTNLLQVESTYDAGLAGQVTEFSTAWASEADAKIRTLDEAKAEAETKLGTTSRDGLAEIDKKYTDACGKMAEIVSTVQAEMASKAEEIANQSWWDRFVSGLKNFCLGLWDALTEFLTTLLIIALVVLAIVVVVAVVILVVWGSAALLAAAAAVASFLAAAATVIEVIGVILTVVSIGFAVMNVVSAWTNPNLTSDERWRATGKGVGDIALEFLPDFGVSSLFKADDASDAARALQNVSEVAARNDPAALANQVDAVADVVGHTDELGEVAQGTSAVARSADGYDTALTRADEAVEAAEAVPTSSVDEASGPPPGGTHSVTGSDGGTTGSTPTTSATRATDDVPVSTADGATGATRATDDVPASTADGATGATRATDDVPSTTAAATDEVTAGVTPNSRATDAGSDVSSPPPRGTYTGGMEPDELVDLTDAQARRHILDGEGGGQGGHRAGTGEPGKTEFPAHWSDELILHYASDIATDPAARADPNNPRALYNRNGQPNRFIYYGIREGVEIKVVVEPATGRIVTAYPTRVTDAAGQLVPAPRNPDVPAAGSGGSTGAGTGSAGTGTGSSGAGGGGSNGTGAETSTVGPASTSLGTGTADAEPIVQSSPPAGTAAVDPGSASQSGGGSSGVDEAPASTSAPATTAGPTASPPPSSPTTPPPADAASADASTAGLGHSPEVDPAAPQGRPTSTPLDQAPPDATVEAAPADAPNRTASPATDVPGARATPSEAATTGPSTPPSTPGPGPTSTPATGPASTAGPPAPPQPSRADGASGTAPPRGSDAVSRATTTGADTSPISPPVVVEAPAAPPPVRAGESPEAARTPPPPSPDTNPPGREPVEPLDEIPTYGPDEGAEWVRHYEEAAAAEREAEEQARQAAKAYDTLREIAEGLYQVWGWVTESIPETTEGLQNLRGWVEDRRPVRDQTEEQSRGGNP